MRKLLRELDQDGVLPLVIMVVAPGVIALLALVISWVI
jgi:hypothetical protein